MGLLALTIEFQFYEAVIFYNEECNKCPVFEVADFESEEKFSNSQWWMQYGYLNFKISTDLHGC